MFNPEVQLCTLQGGNKVTLQSANIDRYPDGIPYVKGIDGSFMAVVVRPKSLESFTTAMYLVDALRERGHLVSRLILPSIPGARQDRLNPSGDVLFTAKSIAADINRRDFDVVVTLDPHSNVSAGLIDRCKVFPLGNLFNRDEWNFYDGIIAPDAGAGHRAQEVANALGASYGEGIEVVQASKNRDVETGKLSGFSVNVESGKHYLVVDDICDGGGTFVGLGQEIKKQGATASLFVSHGIFSKGADKLLSLYTTITTTDSTLYLDPKTTDVRILPITERLIRS